MEREREKERDSFGMYTHYTGHLFSIVKINREKEKESEKELKERERERRERKSELKQAN